MHCWPKDPAAGHVVTGNCKIISDSRIRNIVSKGPKYRFHFHIDFKRWHLMHVIGFFYVNLLRAYYDTISAYRDKMIKALDASVAYTNHI